MTSSFGTSSTPVTPAVNHSRRRIDQQPPLPRQPTAVGPAHLLQKRVVNKSSFVAIAKTRSSCQFVKFVSRLRLIIPFIENFVRIHTPAGIIIVSRQQERAPAAIIGNSYRLLRLVGIVGHKMNFVSLLL